MEPNTHTHDAPEHHHHHPEPHHDRVEIHVNEKPVHLKGHHHTGLQIKEAAIAQQVKIQLDFLLYLVRHHHPNKPVGDDEEVELTHESRFHAIADDDNS
jgi:Multiubiquitin